SAALPDPAAPEPAGPRPVPEAVPGGESPPDSRPARPDETTTTVGTPGPTPTPSPTPTPTPPPTPTPTPTPTPDPCPGGDSDGDGTPDSCDPDDDNDTVTDPNDICPGGDDRWDHDGDGTPNDCDGRDDSPPDVTIGQLSKARDGFLTNIYVPVSAEDIFSGVRRIDVSATVTFSCEGTDGRVTNTFGDTRQGTSSATFTLQIGCDIVNRAPFAIDVTVTATAANGSGVTGGDQVTVRV
ncbi:MAG TPA: hypothetical protein VFI47_11450, partial [Acidimicrobiales bacterium]|nr:hypothetical protein [Acidimicrobiales bacterium]